MHARKAAAQEREPRARELGGGREIEQAERLAEVGVVAHRKVERCAACPSGESRRCRPPTCRQAWTRCVRFGRSSRNARSSRCTRSSAPSRRLRLVADARHLRQQRGGVLALALRRADLLRQRIALRLQVLRARLDVLALALERLEACRVERDAAPRQAGGHRGKIVAQQIDVEHRRILANACGHDGSSPAFRSRARNA